jgi:hypothetical protein
LNDALLPPTMRGMQHREFERVFCQALDSFNARKS